MGQLSLLVAALVVIFHASVYRVVSAIDEGGKDCSCECLCQNGGTLNLTDSSMSCACVTPFSGARCQTSSCRNGGSALQLADGKFTCKCADGFSGDSCENSCACGSPDTKPQCTFGMQIWGNKDTPLRLDGFAADKAGWLQINYKQVLSTSVDNNFPNYPPARGIHALVVDPTTCAVKDTQKFDPLGDGAKAGQAFVDYVNKQPDGTLLVVFTSDEPHDNLQSSYSQIKAFGGPELNDQNFPKFGKFGFVLQKGFPQNAVKVVASGGGPHLMFNVVVSGGSNTTGLCLTTTP